jgi:hypothetical protein
MCRCRECDKRIMSKFYKVLAQQRRAREKDGGRKKAAVRRRDLSPSPEIIDDPLASSLRAVPRKYIHAISNIYFRKLKQEAWRKTRAPHQLGISRDSSSVVYDFDAGNGVSV